MQLILLKLPPIGMDHFCLHCGSRAGSAFPGGHAAVRKEHKQSLEVQEISFYLVFRKRKAVASYAVELYLIPLAGNKRELKKHE